MQKKFLVVGITLFFIFILSSGVLAESGGFDGMGSFFGIGSMLMSDWQLDYIRPIEPGELKKGDYRLSPIIGRINTDEKRDVFSGTTNEKNNDNSTMAYILVFDTGLSDNLTLHSKFAYQPWEKYTYSNNNSDESRSSLFDLFLNYELKEDKQMFFGYNRISSKEKNYDNLDNLRYEEEDTNNIYYLGFEIRGSFLGKNN
jgi:hypothetical protein